MKYIFFKLIMLSTFSLTTISSGGGGEKHFNPFHKKLATRETASASNNPASNSNSAKPQAKIPTESEFLASQPTHVTHVEEDSLAIITTDKNTKHTIYTDCFSGCLGIVHTGIKPDGTNVVSMLHFNKNTDVYRSFMKHLRDMSKSFTSHNLVVFCHDDIEYYSKKWSPDGNLETITNKKAATLAYLKKIGTLAKGGNSKDLLNFMFLQHLTKHPEANIQNVIKSKEKKVANLPRLACRAKDKQGCMKRLTLLLNLAKALQAKTMLPLTSYQHNILDPDSETEQSTQRFGLSISAEGNNILGCFSYLDTFSNEHTKLLKLLKDSAHREELSGWPNMQFMKGIFGQSDTLILPSGISRFIQQHGRLPQEKDYQKGSAMARTTEYFKKYLPEVLEGHAGQLIRRLK